MPIAVRVFPMWSRAARVGVTSMLVMLAACDEAAGGDVSEVSGATSVDVTGGATTDDTEETLDGSSLDSAAEESRGATTSTETDEGAAGSTSNSATGDVEPTETTDSIEPADPFPGMGKPELIVSDLGFGEGPVWSVPRQTLFFTDVYADEILAFDGVDVSVHRSNTEGADGLALDPEDRIIAAQISAHSVARETDGNLEVIADSWSGLDLNAPNDVAVRSDGAIFFTDPTNTGHVPQGVAGVYRLDPDGRMELLDDTFSFPNGILLSRDGTTLIVAESAANELWVFDVAIDGSVSNKRLFANTTGQPDGLTVDVAGSIYATNATGFDAFSPEGDRWGSLDLPTEVFVSNLAFGGVEGQFLFVTTSDELWRIPVEIPGPV
ncbi:MAG: SMP-30/gluconolactonase/LRE family protein [Myxococcota bacterium]